MKNDIKPYEIIVDSKEDQSQESVSQSILLPGEELKLFILFHPTEIGQFDSTIRFRVLDNDFDNLQCGLHGECYEYPVLLENLPPLPMALLGTSSNSTIAFDDLALRQIKTRSFTMKNITDGALRFSWQTHDNIRFEPSIGHLQPYSSKDFRISMSSDQPVSLASESLICEITKNTLQVLGLQIYFLSIIN